MRTAKWGRTLLVAATIATVAVPWAAAQGPGGGGGMRPGMGGPPPAMRQWMDKHRNLMTLGRTARGLGMLDRDPATKLSAAQAKKIVPVLRAWRHKPSMTDAQAAKVNKQILAALKPAQVKRLASRRGPGGGGPGGRPPGGGPPPGGFGRPPGGAGGARPAGGFGGRPGGFGGTPPTPKAFNPLNPDTAPFGRPRDGRRGGGYDALLASLAARTK